MVRLGFSLGDEMNSPNPIIGFDGLVPHIVELAALSMSSSIMAQIPMHSSIGFNR